MNKLIFKLFYYKAPFVILVLMVIFLSGCIPKVTIEQIPHETNKNPEIYFCPKEDCGKILESHINNANFSVYCAFYDLDLKNVINALSKKSKTVDVKLVMDNTNSDGQIKGEGIKIDDNGQLMHNKFCIIDGSIITSGSLNPTDNGNYRNKNNLVVIYSKALAENYNDEFNELWNGDFGEGDNSKYPTVFINDAKIENYFCPEDDCAAKVIDSIKNARKSIHFMTFSFTHEDIADALIKKSDLTIKGILDSTQASGRYSQLKRLKEFGINVKKDTNKYKMHHKVFIIDNQTVITGSFNPTLSGDTRNDENLLIIHDDKIADDFLKEFDDLWE
ncbi:hypothetical protein CMO83_00450 [Candidatus Woesearchaeota archaeon]|nr:hypothetical protein [Candidatus Woesearchaeota archaeon]|tara:strand:- start:19198 stop:20193 length:996 start_codon:yes stop_codon:yes gene_type:complete